MQRYDYSNKSSCPDLSGILMAVGASEMSDKSIDHCNWDQEDGILKVFFVNSLSASDKVVLDSIVG